MPSSINEFRNHQYRVFLAEPYLKLDLQKEIDWHKEHLRKLNIMAKDPSLFHRSRTSHRIEDHHHRHFKEHVLESIPFHEKILGEHERRLKTVLDIMPEDVYRKLRSITVKLKTVPDYMVFDRISKRFFFLVEKPTPDKEKWSKVVKKKGLAEVMFLE